MQSKLLNSSVVRRHLTSLLLISALVAFVTFLAYDNHGIATVPYAATTTPLSTAASTTEKRLDQRAMTAAEQVLYDEDGLRVYTISHDQATELWLAVSGAHPIRIATTSYNVSQVRDGKFGYVHFSPSQTYFEYYIGFWEGGAHHIYDIKQNKEVMNIPMGSGTFTSSEKYFYTCYNTPLDGSADASVYAVPSFTPVLELFAKYPNLAPEADTWSFGPVDIQCHEDRSSNTIVFEFGDVEGTDNNGDTIISIKHRVLFNQETAETQEMAL